MQTQKNCFPRTGNGNLIFQKKRYNYVLKIALLFQFFLINNAFAHHFGTLNGSIQSETGEPIIGIHVRLEGTSFATITNESGHFEIKNIPAGSYTFLASGIGYEAKKENIDIKQNEITLLQYKLNSKTNELSEVVISSGSNRSFSSVNKIDVPLT